MHKIRVFSSSCIVVCVLGSPSLLAAPSVPLSSAPADFSKIETISSGKGQAASTQPEKTYYNFEAVPVRSYKPLERQPKVDATSETDTQIQSKIATSAITPLCTTLSTDTSYTLDGTTTGGSYCYHFEITQRAKTQVFLTGQNANTDFALTLVRHEEDDTLTSLGTSDQPGNADEGLLALTQPGNYYWLMDANASDGSAFQFGAIANTAIDAHELNDAVSLSTTIPNNRTPMIGSMDSAQDIDYFSFVAENGQDLQLRFTDTYSQNEWVVEYFTGTAWSSLNTNTLYNLNDLPTPYTLHVRVSPNPAAPVNPAHEYELVVGARVTASDSVDVGSDENLVRMSNTPVFLTDQVHNELNWSMRVLDSRGNPVEGAEVTFYYYTNDIPLTGDTVISKSSGIASNTISLPDCIGSYSTTDYSGGYTWLSEFNVGEWWIRVKDTDHNDVGVGGDNYPAVTLGHVCDQTIQ
ncbi:hypothetical protein [Marinobacter daepoensis]|uniref:hypothetical protein n=1 Tax=Marinobacter daepoensis TaxID=262077 RepID=UPI00041811F9|nr:hypothetical protein [Marinobacter daepoensis]